MSRGEAYRESRLRLCVFRAGQAALAPCRVLPVSRLRNRLRVSVSYPTFIPDAPGRVLSPPFGALEKVTHVTLC
jgi:hypothetical protein